MVKGGCKTLIHQILIKYFSFFINPSLLYEKLSNFDNIFGNRPVKPLLTRDKTGTSRDKTGTISDKTVTSRDKTGTVGTSRDKTATIRDKTGTAGTKKGHQGEYRDKLGQNRERHGQLFLIDSAWFIPVFRPIL